LAQAEARAIFTSVKERVLVIDDEPSVHDVARGYLEREGFQVLGAINGRDGLAMARDMKPSLIVLDRMLPDLTGEQICAAVRTESEVPILMLSARAGEVERVRGLDLGADDYITKPFSPRELVARVRALMRRANGPATAEAPVAAASAPKSFDDGRMLLDVDRHEVTIDSERVNLTPSEWRLLVALAESPGRVYSRFELINRVQGYEYEGYERTIDAHVKNLRRKIEPDPGRPSYVETVHGVGYRLGSRAL
jgi:DNA-binding response OmpR family regulator